MRNFIVAEIKHAIEDGLVDLAMIGAHAVAQTISEQIYGLRGLQATRFYLARFVDGDRPDLKFSEIADELHGYRNVAAHRWSSISSHSLVFDSALEVGWRRRDDVLEVNPKIFIDCFIDGFRTLGPMWQPVAYLGEHEARCAMYRYLAIWLELPEGDGLRVMIDKLCATASLADFEAQEGDLVKAINERYAIDV